MTEIVQVLVILFGSLVFFRVLGFAGIDRFTTWTVCARIALATMLLFTAIFSVAWQLGTMPCDGAWPADKISVFERWVESGALE
jgi:hypothetical protein